jgi:MOSC domain-containing protein YiiM
MPAEILAEVVAAVASSDTTSSAVITKINPGDLGENVTTTGLDLRNLSRGTKLTFVTPPPLPSEVQVQQQEQQPQPDDGSSNHVPAVIQIQGLRNPCPQIDKFRSGLKEKFIVRDENRNIIGRLAGVMATVESGGEIRPGMEIVVEEPTVHVPLECV